MLLPSPKGLMNFSTLYPRAQGSDRTKTVSPTVSAAFLLEKWNSSISSATRFSNTAITVVIAARVMKRKKRNPQHLPPPISEKMFGRLRKISPGPEPGLIPKEKQIGKIISPAVRATNVSSTMMNTLSLLRECSFPI